MSELHNKKVLLGITGGIAAYKSAVLARRLIDAGATVRVVMTAGAQAFIQPLTFQALTGNPVHTDLLDADAEAAMGHIELARWCDLILIAPASANTLARIALGMADDLLCTACLATDAPIIVAPAMNRLMWTNAATQNNRRVLEERGVRFLGPAEGAQACGETGAGRLLEPEQIIDQLELMLKTGTGTGTGTDADADADTQFSAPAHSLADKHVLITAGPTREAIDPVRYISNHSSGKMGFAIAEAAASMGAHVTLVAGPVSLSSSPAIHRVDVISANQMLKAVMQAAGDSDIFISVAAVSDYRVEQIMDQKIKKNDDQMQLTLVKNPDILKQVAALEDRPFCVGFAAETQHVERHARAKLVDKKLDMIAANQVAQADNPVFGSDTNALDIFCRGGGDAPLSIGPANKAQIAVLLLDAIAEQLNPH